MIFLLDSIVSKYIYLIWTPRHVRLLSFHHCSSCYFSLDNMIVASEMAMGTGVITGCLFQIPNEKMVFSGDPTQKSRGEDAIIAYTWDHFLNNPDEPEWLLRLPMVKASLRAMDAMSKSNPFYVTTYQWQCSLCLNVILRVAADFAAQNLRLTTKGKSIDYYSVAGASKRGWTTWLVGAVDPVRVVAIVPIVLDAINFVAVEKHQWRSYGGWSSALKDYYEMNITSRYDDPNMVKLQEVVDPYFYADRSVKTTRGIYVI